MIKVEDLTKLHRGIGGAKPLTGHKREREVIKRRNDVTSTKEKVDRETLPDGTVREGVERETAVDKSIVETEREKELEVQVEHYRDMVSHLELSIQRKDKGSMLNSNTYNSECGAYIVLRTLALAKKALRELVDEEVLEHSRWTAPERLPPIRRATMRKCKTPSMRWDVPTGRITSTPTCCAPGGHAKT